MIKPMSHDFSADGLTKQRTRKAWGQVLLLMLAVPMGIVSAWLVQAPSMESLAAKASGGADTGALLRMVNRAAMYPEASAELQKLLVSDAGAMQALAGLAATHEEALLCLISLGRTQPQALEYLRELEMDYSLALAVLQRVEADAIEKLLDYAEECANACFLLGVACENGCHVTQDWAQAAEWYGLALEGGYEPAWSYFAPAAYQAGLEEERLSAAAAWFREAAECGYAAAQCALGVCYAECGEYSTAAYWYRMAAGQELSDAQYNLGWCYLYGEGVEQDSAEALRWFRLAAEQGDALAQYHVGRAYELGEGVAQDYAEAVRWYRWAAEQEEPAAQCALGHCYAQGHGVTQSWTRAVHFYRLAAEQNRSEAQLALAHCYEQGLGVTRDADQARHWRECAESESQPQTNES